MSLPVGVDPTIRPNEHDLPTFVRGEAPLEEQIGIGIKPNLTFDGVHFLNSLIRPKSNNFYIKFGENIVVRR